MSRVRIIGVLLAVSTLPEAMPSATESQLIASAVSASSPMAATQDTGLGRRPEPDEQRDDHDDRQSPAPPG